MGGLCDRSTRVRLWAYHGRNFRAQAVSRVGQELGNPNVRGHMPQPGGDALGPGQVDRQSRRHVRARGAQPQLDPARLYDAFPVSPGKRGQVGVHGELDPVTCSQLRERLAWVSENCPRRLVLDLRGVADRFGEQIAALIAAARQQLPPGCLLDVRSAIPAMRASAKSPTGPSAGQRRPVSRLGRPGR